MPNLMDTAIASGNFSKLINAIEVAGLVDNLQEPGPITVFAPTDKAFEQLPAGTLDSLLSDLPKLKKILLYHIVSGDVRSDDLNQIDEAPTIEGSVLAIDSENGVKVNEAKVLQADILADNGVIHVIDRVLMPAMVAGKTSA